MEPLLDDFLLFDSVLLDVYPTCATDVYLD
jgi:hypothetical protein